MKLSQEEEKAISSGQTFYNLQAVGIYSYMVRFNDPNFRPTMTVEQMMKVFSQSDPDFRFLPRSNGKMGTIAYQFTNSSITPPSASQRPQNGVRSITDLFQANNTTVVWQFYRSAICEGDRGLYIVRLFNSPAQQSFTTTPLNENENAIVPSSSKVLGYRVVWRPVAIELTPEGLQKRTAELMSEGEY